MTRRPKQKTEPYRWGKSTGLLHQWMLRDYIRWLFPQLGAAYEPPQGVKDFTLGQQATTDGKQPEPFRPRSARGPVFKRDLEKFKDYVFLALAPESDKNPFQLTTRCTLAFVPDLQRLHQHLLFLLSKKRQAM
jgi:hypothetical protein